jgi:proteic killer suppression protein
VLQIAMIGSFRDKETERIWLGLRARRLPSDIQQIALRKLFMIEAAESIDDLKEPPGNRLEMLRGDRKGCWSVRINQQWRICFKWENGHAEDIEIIDYH